MVTSQINTEVTTRKNKTAGAELSYPRMRAHITWFCYVHWLIEMIWANPPIATQTLSWCQLCRHWRYRRLLWQPPVPPETKQLSLYRKLSWCQFRHHVRHRRLLWQPPMPPVTTKLASWQRQGLSVLNGFVSGEQQGQNNSNRFLNHPLLRKLAKLELIRIECQWWLD